MNVENHSQRRKSFIATPAVEIIYEGSKTYWKARATLEIVIALHTKQLCYEVLVFHPDLGKESPRIYLSATLLLSKVDQNELQEKIKDKKEAFIRSKKPVNALQLHKEALDNVLVHYILSRLSISVATIEEFNMAILPQTGDVVEDPLTQRIDVVYADKPLGVVPLESNFQKKITNGEIMTALSQFKSETAALCRATELAELSISSVDGFKNMLAERLSWKHRFSPVRLRWMKVINRVMVVNYVQKVRERLEQIAERERERAREAAEESKRETGQAQGLGQGQGGKVRPKILRKTVDNSLLSPSPASPQKLPALSPAPLTGGSPSQRILRASSHDNVPPPLVLPPVSLSSHPHSTPLSHTPSHSQKRRGKGEHYYNKPMQRRSFHVEEKRGGLGGESGGERGAGGLGAGGGLSLLLSDASAPSLLESYHRVSSQALLSSPTHHMERESSLRSVRMGNR